VLVDGVQGTVTPGFEAVRERFEALYRGEGDCAGQFCAYVGGKLVVDLWAGPDVSPEDIQGVFSSTKGAGGVCMALLVQSGALDLDKPVAYYWPEFASGGKEAVTVRIALSHQAGLPGVEPQLGVDELIDHERVAGRLAAQVPHWLPGKAHGYHAITIGTIMEELARRTVGMPVWEFFRKEVGEPRLIDFFIATPQSEECRVKLVLPLEPNSEQKEVLTARQRSVDSLSGMAFNAAARRTTASEELLPNIRKVRQAGQPALSGVGSARGLARLYAMCIGEVDGWEPLLTETTRQLVTQIQAVGEDLVLRLPTRYGIVFQKADDRLWYGSHQSFGHDGAGGSIGVADPWYGIAYAWVPRRMTFPGGADERGLELAAAVRKCVSGGARGAGG